MVYGIGCDLCEIARLERSLGGAHGRPFCAACTARGSARRLRLWAARTARPAPRRTLRPRKPSSRRRTRGWMGPFALDEIEAVRLPSGAPAYHFAGRAAAWMQEHRLAAQLSLSHESGLALAFCVLETLPE